MVPISDLKAGIDLLKVWHTADMGTRVSWVNWRDGYQLKMGWNGSAAFNCYLDFGKAFASRQSAMKAAFERFAEPGTKPRVEQGHGWTELDHSFKTKQFVSVNEVAELAKDLGLEFTIIYCQTCSGSRHIFETMGIALVPGEVGKELVNGELIPYSCPMGRNL
jgi:hypothetical protein